MVVPLEIELLEEEIPTIHIQHIRIVKDVIVIF